MYKLLMGIVLMFLLALTITDRVLAQEEIVIESAVVKNDLKRTFAEIERQARARVDRSMIPADWTEEDIKQYINFLRSLGVELKDPNELKGSNIPLRQALNQKLKFRSYFLPIIVGAYYVLTLNQQQININIIFNKEF